MREQIPILITNSLIIPSSVNPELQSQVTMPSDGYIFGVTGSFVQTAPTAVNAGVVRWWIRKGVGLDLPVSGNTQMLIISSGAGTMAAGDQSGNAQSTRIESLGLAFAVASGDVLALITQATSGMINEPAVADFLLLFSPRR